MSVSILPIRLGQLVARPARKERPAPKHSAPAEVERLRRLLDGAHALIEGQGLQIDAKDRKITDVEAERDQANERATNTEKALAQAEEAIRLRDRTIADLQQRLDVAVKAEHVIAKTQELDCRSLHERFADGPVRALHHSPMAAVTDPGHI